MITIEQQQNLLINVSKRLKKKVTAYAIGGTAMMFYGFKDATLDIDLVFENETERASFKEAVISLGYQEMNAIQVYGKKDNKPEMFKLDNERFDLFLLEVIYFIFSNDMQKRAKQIHQYGDNLIIKIADPHDIILMKCATDRAKDKDDARRIINSTKIDWNIIINESKTQIALGKEMAAFELGCFLEDLKNEMKLDIPMSVLDELFKIVQNQAKEKIKKEKKR